MAGPDSPGGVATGKRGGYRPPPRNAPVEQAEPAEEELPPKHGPMSVGGFVKNLIRNTSEIVEGVADAFSISVKSAMDIIRDAEWLPDSLPHVPGELANTGKALIRGIAEPYRKHGGRVWYEEPMTFADDAMTFLTGGGWAAGKLGKVAKLSKLEALGKAMEAIPGKIARGIAEAPLRAANINPRLRKILTTLDREEATIAVVSEKRLHSIIDNRVAGLSDSELALLDKLEVEGGMAAELAANPRVARAHEAYRKIVSLVRERKLGEKGRNLLSSDVMEEAVVKKYANRKYGDISDESLRRAREEIGRLEVKPIYTPARGEGGRHTIDDLTLGPDEVKVGGVGFLEPYKGGKSTSDPRIYMKAAISEFINVERRLKFLDRVIQHPDLIRPVTSGEVPLKDIAPQGIFQKYFQDSARPQAAAIAALKRKHGIKEAERMLLEDPVTQKYVSSISAIAATDPTVANYLRWTFKRAGGRLKGFLRVYDKILSAFKVSATTVIPRYYTGNIVGAGMLMVMAGEYGLNWRVMRRILNNLPPELRVGGRAIVQENPLMAKVYKLADIAQGADDMGRANLWIPEVARAFKQTGASFTALEGGLEDFYRAVGNSVEDLSTLQSRVQILDEQIARSIPELRGLQAEVAAKETKLTALEDRMVAAERMADQAGVDTIRDRASVQARKAYYGYRDGKAKDLFQKKKRLGEITAEMREKMVASGEFHRRVPEAAELAEVSRRATDLANSFFGDYFGLGPIERGVFRRIVPFYTFTKAMTKLAFTLPFTRPKTMFFWHRYSQTLMDMVGDGELPEYMAPYLPVGGYENGDTLWMRVKGLSPFGSVRVGSVGNTPVPSIVEFWKQNPIIRLSYRWVGGKDEFSVTRPREGEVWVEAGNGRVNQFPGDGKIETVIPQLGFVEGLSEFFPAVQMARQLITEYDVRKGPIKDQDGEYKYPLSFGQRIADSLGVKLKVANAEDLKRVERIRAFMVIKGLVKQFPRQSPEGKEYIRGVLKDYQEGYYRKFKGY